MKSLQFPYYVLGIYLALWFMHFAAGCLNQDPITHHIDLPPLIQKQKKRRFVYLSCFIFAAQ